MFIIREICHKIISRRFNNVKRTKGNILLIYIYKNHDFND